MFVTYFKLFSLRFLMVILFGQLSYKITTLAEDYSFYNDPSCFLPLIELDNIGTEAYLLEKRLLTSVIYGDSKNIERLLKEGANPNVIFTTYDSTKKEDTELVLFFRVKSRFYADSTNREVLYSRPTDPFLEHLFTPRYSEHPSNIFETTALHVAVRRHSTDAVTLLLEYGARSISTSDEQRNPFEVLSVEKRINPIDMDLMVKAFIESSEHPQMEEIVSVYKNAMWERNIVFILALVRHAREHIPDYLLYPNHFRFRLMNLFRRYPRIDGQNLIYYQWVHSELVNQGLIEPRPSL